MVAKKIWFGNTTHAQWVPCPATGMRRTRQGWSEELVFENGGAWLEESAAWHTVYEMEFPVADSSKYDGIEAFERFAAREYGDDYLRFVDPMQTDRNLFSPEWARPTLIEQGWKNWGGTEPSFIGVGTGRYAEWPVDSPVGEFQGRVFTFLIPPGHTLHLGGLGYNGSDSRVKFSLQFPDGSFENVPQTNVEGWWTSVSGDDWPWVKVGFRLILDDDPPYSFSLRNLIAQIHPSNVTPAYPSRPIPGEGHSGLRFRGKALPETYVMKDRHLSGMSAELIEIEPWED